MEDIAPVLLERISQDFIRLLGDSKIESMNYTSAGDYAEKVGAALAEAFRLNLDPDILPDGKMYWNIADRVIRPMLEQDHVIISDATTLVQQALNQAAGIGLKAQRAPLNEDRVSGILNKVASAKKFEDVVWVLDEPIKTFSRSVVDDTLRRNVEFQGKAGLRPKIIRRAESKCCKWCSQLEGVYDYPDVPDDIYRRHNRCRCRVEYDPSSGKRRQNVHTKQWKNSNEYDIIEERKAVGINRTPQKLSEHPSIFASFTPEKLRDTLLQEGFEIKPLMQGSLKGIPFDEGGGFKVNFEDGGLLQYHPANKSHHSGAYYKISTGKGGTHRYDLDGKEKTEN